MKVQLLLGALIVVVVLALAGCPGPQESQAPQPPQAATPTAAPAATPVADHGAPLGSIKVGDKAICTVCAADGKQHDMEEVKATLDYQGKTYAFCSVEEKAQFISQHAK